jgi:arylsulfatase A-like enzyme
MRRRDLILAGSALAGARAIAAPVPEHPNVVIFLADDLGWKDTGYQGSEGQTPTIDRLCREGVRFTNLYAFPLCSPTRSALLTGRNPARFGLGYTVVRPWSTYGLPPSETTMADVFRAAGYQTAVTGKWHLGHANVAHLPRSRGFDHFYGHLNGAIDYFTHDRDGGIDWQRNGTALREQGYSTDLVAAEADRWIAARDKSKPFFLYMPWNAPHSPLQAPADLLEKYSAIKDKKRQTYLAMVDSLDRGIERVMRRLEAEKILDNTLVLFVSDNGGAVSTGANNGPLRSGKSSVYEGGIRVPGLAYWPGKLKPGACEQLLTVYDLLPTLAAACRIPAKTRQPLDGMNHWSTIQGSAPPQPRQNLLFCVQPDRGPRQHALRDGPWKLIRIGQAPCDVPRESLYNIENDPYEKNDLLKEQPEIASRLRTLMESWIALVPPGEASYSLEPHPGWVTPKDWAKVAVD